VGNVRKVETNKCKKNCKKTLNTYQKEYFKMTAKCKMKKDKVICAKQHNGKQ